MRDSILNKLDRLNDKTNEMFRSIDHLSEEQLKDQAYGWNVLQVFEHLNQSENLSLSYMQKKVQAGDQMQEAGALHAFRMWLTNLALISSLKWKAPSYIASPGYTTLGNVKDQWGKTREQLARFVKDFPEPWLDKLVYKHPMGGRQNLEKAVDSFIYHQIHHIRQLDRIKKKINA